MLEKLLTIKSVKKMMNQFSYEYWLDVLEEDFDEDDEEGLIDVNRVGPASDVYMDYIVTNGYKGNNYMKFIKTFVDNQERMEKHFSDKGNSAAVSFVNIVPYAFKEMIKVCSRVIDFSESRECSTVRNMTMGKQNFINYEDATLLMKLTGEESLNETEAREFWGMFETVLEYLPTEEICAANQTSEESEEVARVEDSMSEFISVLCKACPDFCNGTDIEEMVEYRQFRATPLMDSIYTIGLWISVVFLAVTLVVFFLVPHLKNSLHGKCTIFHLLSMIVAYSSLAMAQYIHMSAGVYCLFNGFALQFSFLAMFFWLNVMCFDILLAFSFLRRKSSRENGGDKFKMIMYSAYAWGVPSIILAVSLAIEYGPWLETSSPSRPGIGDPKCFFKNLRARWLYLYGPIAFLILSNLVMFTITAIMIFRHSKSSSILQNNDSRSANKSENARLLIYLNLFILMGANWLGEVLAWNWPNLWIFYVTDITTALQGVIVFFLFVCKRRVLGSLAYTLTNKFQSFSNSEKTSGTEHASSSEMKSLSANANSTGASKT